ncbi:glycosyltransferase family 4 protein [Alkalibacterium sp. 20]|uniref:glycosyltransferase family 4 protein n=1 Tax=Alkalibacterium sp. 20 TaxID=1798803 RepID=UPI0008FFEEB2|nr:glycosyltransferase family 4 protein [Alkalibacterium sp. 20]OJF94713.1 hypothetical protein AX762_07105 [Alkalibacterium sp. 20]
MNRVVLVSLKYPPVYSGYGKQLESVTKDLLNKSDEFSITVLTAYKESKDKPKSNYEVINLLDKYDDENSKTVYPFSRQVFKWLVANKNHYDIIHCVKAGPEAMACNLASKLLKKKLIVKVAQDELSDREIDSAKGLKKQTRLFRQRLLKNVDFFIAISEEIEQNIKNRTGENTKIVRIPNGVNTKQFEPADADEKTALRKALNFSSDELILLYTGAINKRKGVDDLLKALEMYESKVYLKVVLCGPVLEDIKLEEKIEMINNKGYVSVDYRGKVSNVDEYMKAADMFILPSYSEGLPNVLLEACSSGLPAVATDIGGSRDILIDGKNGYLVNTNQPDEIKGKLTLLAENEQDRINMGNYSREFIEKAFALDKVSDAYMKLYETVCKY